MDRRDFLKGLLLASAAGFLGLPEAHAGGEYPVSHSPNKYHEVPLIPWGYVELDPDEVFKRGHLGYWAGECGAGAFWAITSLLREKKGYPYNYMPIPSLKVVLEAVRHHKHLPLPMKYMNGGVEGYATLCGALNGASAAIEFALGPEKAKPIIRRLFRWYEVTAFPTGLANEWAVKHKFYTKGKTDKPLPSIAVHSVLCHIVVSEWCKKAGYASGSKERSERCARITAAVARQAVIFMNAAYKAKNEKELERALDKIFPFELSQETQTCRACHHKGKDYRHGQFMRGYMECDTCHHINLREHMIQATKFMEEK